MRLPVFIASWQIECCWEPPAIGDLLAWHLVFTEQPDADAPPGRGLVQLELSARPIAWEGGTQGRHAVRLDGPGLSLYWEAPHAALGRVQLAGYVHEDHHGQVPETLPHVSGIVRAIDVEERHYVEVPPGSRSWRYASTPPPSYRPVTTSPKWFRSLQPERGGRAAETGILTTVEITPGPVASPPGSERTRG